jgi:hypothetical protein
MPRGDVVEERAAREVLSGQVVGRLRDPRAAAVVDDDRLTADDRRRIVDAFLLLIEGAYVHLPQKRATYGRDPVQRLRLLRQRTADTDGWAFHNEMVKISTDLRDAHTRYIGPRKLDPYVAVLPFLLESFGSTEQARYVVSKVVPFDEEEHEALAAGGFVPGVEVTHWNGTPIRRAVDLHADHETGGRPDARLARAIESLTIRSLRYGLLPDEHWVTVSFATAGGAGGEVRIDWRLVDLGDAGGEPQSANLRALGPRVYAGSPAAEASRRARTLMFAPHVWRRAGRGATRSVAQSRREARPGDWIAGHFEDNVAARTVATEAGTFGHLRLWSFDLADDAGYLAEVKELLDAMPRRGLILDLRGNPGGLIWAAERLLQLFTPHPVTPTSFSMVATDLARSLADAPQNRRELSPWRGSLLEAVSSGELYTRGAPLTPPESCNDLGQHYPGPVVAVVDATTYSAGDLFAAGFVDNRVGTLVSVGRGTGGGGANVWFWEHVTRALSGTGHALASLPEDVGFTVAFRRCLRAGPVAGLGIEDVGVLGHIERSLTLTDLTEKNKDLMDFCGRLLASEPVTDLRARTTRAGVLSATTRGLDRIDVYVDERPVHTQDLDPGAGIELKIEGAWSQVDVIGFSSQIVRQRRRLYPR